MKQNDYSLRPEAEADYRETEALVRESFWNVYRPGCTEHYILHILRDDPAYLPELALVMEKDGRLIGQTAYVQSTLCADDGRRVPILTLGPIGILPGFQRQGYGRILLEASLEKAASLGWGARLSGGEHTVLLEKRICPCVAIRRSLLRPARRRGRLVLSSQGDDPRLSGGNHGRLCAPAGVFCAKSGRRRLRRRLSA